MFNGGALTWSTEKQSTVSMSTAEAEYVAAAAAGQEVCWLRNMFAGLGFTPTTPTTMHIDNATALKMTTDEGNIGRRRHINIKHHKIREWVADKVIDTCKIDTRENLADIFTKAMGREPFVKFREVILGNADPSTLKG
jgi:hypothetical protein